MTQRTLWHYHPKIFPSFSFPTVCLPPETQRSPETPLRCGGAFYVARLWILSGKLISLEKTIRTDDD